MKIGEIVKITKHGTDISYKGDYKDNIYFLLMVYGNTSNEAREIAYK